MENRSILEIAILEMGRMKNGKSFSSSEVVKWIYPQDWSSFLPDLLEAMIILYKEGKIRTAHNEIPVAPDEKNIGFLQITLIKKTN
jgi:hypothetical protein